eukprot:403358557
MNKQDVQYSKLFKEYAICDLSLYKTGNIGLRWCTEKDIVTGKGSKICGNKHCDKNDEALQSFEVNMNYVENGENKNALVKVNLCIDCAIKLNYKKLKDKVKKAKKEKKSKKKDKKKSKNKNEKKKHSKDSSKDSDSD